MNLPFVRSVCMFALLAALGLGPGVSPAAGALEKVTDLDNAADVLTHGPIHEAFAESVALDPEPGIIVPKAPPYDIDEIPPTQKPEGDVDWIPGYWAWDDDQNDFIWVSGIWRAVPPNRQWIPGYWIKVENGFQWVSGYWALETEIDTQYLPEPPESVEAGPNVDAPTSNYGWVPGCWIWLQGRYVWRPGYWEIMRPNWVWVPDAWASFLSRSRTWSKTVRAHCRSKICSGDSSGPATRSRVVSSNEIILAPPPRFRACARSRW